MKNDSTDRFRLERFVIAQAPVIASVLRELEEGRKQTHWMWFVFPQLRDLGHSAMARNYGIASLDEARAFLAHPLLGPRLALCSQRVVATAGRSLREIFGSPDDMKFRSSMTLFARASGMPQSIFDRALERYCGGVSDARTLALLESSSLPPRRA